MEPTLHKVTEKELPVLQQWLGQYLPESHKMYYLIEETIRGLWRGPTFYTLGWPNILAAAEGPLDAEKSPCALFLLNPAKSFAFSPSPDHLEKMILNSSCVMDWTKPIFFVAIPKRLTPAIEKIAQRHGGCLNVSEHVMMEAEPGDIPELPVPEGFEVRDLDPDTDTEYVVSTWPYRNDYAHAFVREHIRNFPSVGLFDQKNGKPVGVEVSYVHRALGMLHVEEEFRGRGLGKVVTSHLAQKHFRKGHSVFVWVEKDNMASIRMHEKVGFKIVEPGDFDFIMYHRGNLQEYMDGIGASR